MTIDQMHTAAEFRKMETQVREWIAADGPWALSMPDILALLTEATILRETQDLPAFKRAWKALRGQVGV